MAIGGVDKYIVGKLEVEVFFPEGLEGCLSCKYKRYRITGDTQRTICSLTYESLDEINYMHERGKDCPLVFDTE